MTITISPRTLVAFATGLAVALIAVFVFQAWRVDAAPGDTDSTFVPITPCRLIDTRPAPDRVGPISSLGLDDTNTITVHGTNGECTIPTDAVGLSLNMTAVGATAPTFITVWPDGPRPLASSLNPAPGQPPTPNAVTTTLSPSGSFEVYNKQGIVNLIIDVNGYYTKTSLQELQSQIAALKAAQPFAVSNHVSPNLVLTATAAPYVSVSVTAPVAGQVTVNSTADVHHPEDGGSVRCAIYETADIPSGISNSHPSFQRWTTALPGTSGLLSGTRTFDIDAGATTSYSLACHQIGDGGQAASGNLTAIFTPAP